MSSTTSCAVYMNHMNDKERKAFLKAKVRNLKRKYAKVVQHADLNEEAIELKAEIDGLERELKLM